MNQPDEPQRVTPKGGFFKEVPDFQTEEKKMKLLTQRQGPNPLCFLPLLTHHVVTRKEFYCLPHVNSPVK